MGPQLDVPLDECVPLGEAPRIWPAAAGGRRVARSTPWRYAKYGVSGVRLRTMRVPGVGLVVHPSWIAEFVAAVNAAESVA
jgi:hypothetical protein